MKKAFGLFFLLSACAGGFSGGGSGLPGAVGGGSGEGPGPGVEMAAAAGSDGVLSSQSSSSDIATKFVRDYALDFDGETESEEILIERPKVGPSQAFGKASIRKVPSSKALQMVAVQGLESAIQALNQEFWVRVIDCGNFPDAEIESLIPPEDLNQPWAQDRLLWLVLHLPRPDRPVTVECQNPSYRDFPILDESKVDLTELAGEPQDLFFFTRVSSADWSKGGELALDAPKPLSDEQWLELAKDSRLRIVRLLPHGHTIRVHPIPAYHLSPN